MIIKYEPSLAKPNINNRLIHKQKIKSLLFYHFEMVTVLKSS